MLASSMATPRRALFHFCVVFLSINSVIKAQWVVDDDGCRTPDRSSGTCVTIGECKYINDVLDNAPQPLSQKIIKLLQSYQCGYQGSSVKVCCPSKPITSELIQKEIAPPDVSRHRNINLLPDNCGLLDTTDRIIGGDKTGLLEFPWMALISYRTAQGPDFKCGATILNDRYILTAAHCITNLKYELLGVRVGDHDITTKTDCEKQLDGRTICAPPFQDVLIEKVIPHPQYNTTVFTNDIGLLRVSQMKTSQENIKPVCLPLGKTRNYNFTDRHAVVTGWGSTTTKRFSNVLLKVEVPMIPLEECLKRYVGLGVTIDSHQLCAGGRNNKDSCHGDSGGPLHIVATLNDDSRYIQQGVVSYGPKFCGTANNPGVYTRVAFYMDWILDNIQP